ncbi:rod shape-determining protein MreC [Erythrobacter sp. BLCC-B19]|uniref:rod shape-determining protein MreC n=1 Tax=Erythrobacter sp. BLCC-B19 TaxID=3025315 RepID=UPI00235F844C|nr:rod shape-determining protein MreC [Erythrobacter sp. BLCC-B19]WDA40603.1 rod shape-determining protein MreC [Erythrobacter sp. BLCC-B19]
MAPPSSRRSGFSKKAQYSLFTGYVLAGGLAVLGAGLLALSLWQPSAFAPLRGAASDVVAPAGTAAAVTRSGSQGFFASIAGYFNAGSQNAELRREMELARIRLAEAEAVKAENARLKGLLGLRDSEVKPVVMARLVGSTTTSGRRHAYLGAGTASGVLPGMPVVSERGVIGRVLEAGRNSSRVLLLTDSESVLPVRRAKDNVIAFAEGRGDGLLRIRLVNLGINPLKVGDMMVTSGAGGYYRPGVAVAVIAKITPDGGIARLVAEPAATSFVAVEPVAQPAAVSELTEPDGGNAPVAGPPAAPAASPAATPSGTSPTGTGGE